MSAQFIKDRIDEIAKKLRELDIKIDIYSRTDRFAHDMHKEKYIKLDMECLELLTQLREVENGEES
jgi:hypothetical protein